MKVLIESEYEEVSKLAKIESVRAYKELYNVRNMNQLMKMYSRNFPDKCVQSALAYITTFKSATLYEIGRYFEMSMTEMMQVERAIDEKPLNFITTNRKLASGHSEGVQFEFTCPRLWQEYRKGNNWFTKEMLTEPKVK